jgi:hypothetical protein
MSVQDARESAAADEEMGPSCGTAEKERKRYRQVIEDAMHKWLISNVPGNYADRYYDCGELGTLRLSWPEWGQFFICCDWIEIQPLPVEVAMAQEV